MQDGEIIRLYRSGEEERAFSEIVRSYSERLYWHVRHFVCCHEDADDLVQEIFVKIWAALPSFREEAQLFTWIYRIATNEALRLIHSRRSDTCPIDTAPAKVIGNIEADNYVDFDDAIAVKFQQAIHSLPPKQQATFNLRYYDELDYEEIAEITQSTPTSARTNYHIAKQKIETYMNNKI